VTRFGQVNSYLMRAPGFQLALDQRSVIELLQNAHVRDRFAAESGVTRGAAPTIPAIRH
jgi:hypothetical protein